MYTQYLLSVHPKSRSRVEDVKYNTQCDMYLTQVDFILTCGFIDHNILLTVKQKTKFLIGHGRRSRKHICKSYNYIPQKLLWSTPFPQKNISPCTTKERHAKPPLSLYLFVIFLKLPRWLNTCMLGYHFGTSKSACIQHPYADDLAILTDNILNIQPQ